MTGQADARTPDAGPADQTTAPAPANLPDPLVRQVEQLPDGRRITYYARAAR